MNIKEILAEFNIVAQCKKYGVSLWQCPQFLFLIMGAIIIVSAISAYAIGTRYIENPIMVSLLVLLLTAILFILSFIITQSFEKLAEASRMKTEFINIVSHQLRAPLTNLKWSAEILTSGKLGNVQEKHEEYFGILKENSKRMEDLINDLLTVSRLEQGQLPFKKKEISLDSLTEEMISGFDSFVKASNIKLTFKSEKKPFLIYTDPHQLKIVIENFLDNAIRYIHKKGEINVYLSARGKDAYFEVKDNGVGIPKKDQRYIFQKFFRSKNALRHQTHGSGLGLFITKSIIKRLGGKIGFNSEENQGTTFWFTLPIA
ncbi:HAMP domain-containing histidine kinase [Candidatus Parcubacteria bacterium]|nr:HAMP domain-containing histidine kinase [Candidatus Parcubacteria bacterium]